MHARQEVESEDAKSKNILGKAFWWRLPARRQQHFGREIWRSSDGMVFDRDSFRVVYWCNDPEIDQFDRPRLIGCAPECLRYNDVCRFDVAVYESTRMHVRERRRNLPEYGASMMRRHSAIVHQVGECRTLNEVEDEPEHIFAWEIEHDVTRNDRWVVTQLRYGFGFAASAFDGRWWKCGQMHELHGLQGFIERIDDLPDGSLTTFAELLNQSIPIYLFVRPKFHNAVLHHTAPGLKQKTRADCTLLAVGCTGDERPKVITTLETGALGIGGTPTE